MEKYSTAKEAQKAPRMAHLRGTSQFSAIPVELWAAPLTPTEIRVYAALALFANKDTGVCHPSHRVIAQRAAIQETAVSPAIKKLEDRGIIVVDRQERCHWYRLVPPVEWRSNLNLSPAFNEQQRQKELERKGAHALRVA